MPRWPTVSKCWRVNRVLREVAYNPPPMDLGDLSDESTDRRIFEARIESLRKVVEYMIEAEYNDFFDRNEPEGHIYRYVAILDAWVEELEKGRKPRPD
jgi:hypothetical protein